MLGVGMLIFQLVLYLFVPRVPIVLVLMQILLMKMVFLIRMLVELVVESILLFRLMELVG